MRYCFKMIIMLFVLGQSVGDCLAGETANTSLGGGSPSSDLNAQVAIGYLPSAELHGVPGDANITDYRLKLSRLIKLNERLTLTLGAGYGLKHIETSSLVALPQDLHALFLEVGARYQINDMAFASLRLNPGFYSDFRDLGGDDLRMPVLALGGYSFKNSFTVIGGFIYRFGSRSSQYIPALGFSYQPDQYWRFDLVAPRPGITYFVSRQLHLFVAGDFASDEYELKDHSLGAKAIKYSDYKAMAGFNFFPVPKVKLSTSIGYAFERRFLFYDSIRSDLRMDDVPFFRVSLDVGW